MSEKEKPPEVRHFEHEDFVKHFERLDKRDEERTQKLTEFMADHADNMNNLRVDMITEMRTLERGVAEKTSMDSGLMVQIKDFNRRVEKVEDQSSESIKTLAQVTATVDRINEDHKKGMKAFSDTLEVHSKAIKILEGAGGKIAIGAWKLIGVGVAIPVLVALIVALLTGRITI